MRATKSIKFFFNYFLGPILFIWLSLSIYHNIKSQPHLSTSWNQIRQSFTSNQIFYLIAAILLIPINWGIETRKWKIAIDPIHPISYGNAFKAVLSGVTFSVSMPNRIGEYLGRVLYLPEGFRLRSIPVTLICSFSQLLVTMMAGCIGLLFLKSRAVYEFQDLIVMYDIGTYIAVLSTLFLLFIYYRSSSLPSFFNSWIRKKKFAEIINTLREFKGVLLTRLLTLSIGRYLVFLLQYILVFQFFGLPVNLIDAVLSMFVIFLVLAVIPSIALVEVGVRGEVSLGILGMFTTNSLAISLSSVTIWFLNLIIPAIVGSLLLLNLRIFKRRTIQVQKVETHSRV